MACSAEPEKERPGATFLLPVSWIYHRRAFGRKPVLEYEPKRQRQEQKQDPTVDQLNKLGRADGDTAGDNWGRRTRQAFQGKPPARNRIVYRTDIQVPEPDLEKVLATKFSGLKKSRFRCHHPPISSLWIL